jgi:integrase
MKVCPLCGERRGTKRRGWNEIIEAGQVIGYTCPACPTWDEPIRRTETAHGVRFTAVVGTPGEDGRRRQLKRTFDTLDEARVWVDEVRDENKRHGAYRRADGMTVDQLAERWLNSRTDIRRVTVDGYRTNLTRVRERIGKRRVVDIDTAGVEELARWLLDHGSKDGGPIKAGSVRAALRPLSMMFDMAVRDRLVTENPVARARKPRGVKRVGKDLEHWTSDELLRFRDAADLDPLAGGWRLTLCGLTRADVCGLRWGDVDLDAGTVTIRQGRVALIHGDATDEPKSEQRRRTVPVETIHAGTVRLLRKMRAAQAQDRLGAGQAWHETGLVLVDQLGRPMRPELYSDRFRRLCKFAGVPSIRLHSVRHSLAFWLHSLGVPPRDAAALLGHTLEVHLSTYLPEGGETGIATAAAALGRAANGAPIVAAV